MTTSAKPARVVRCPSCGGDSQYDTTNPWRPFCSERCKNHDFGAWASERYRVPDPMTSDSHDDGGAEAPPHH